LKCHRQKLSDEVINMAKKGMARPERTHTRRRNDIPPVPEIEGKSKHRKEHANPILSGTSGPQIKVYHSQNRTGTVDERDLNS
jgi:hypothetical protein